METIFDTRRQDKKTNRKKLSLQWVFSTVLHGADQQDSSYYISDKRNVGVCTRQDFKESTAGTRNQTSGNTGDGLLGSLLIEQLIGQFMGAVLCPFLPSFLTGIDLSNTADLADEFWLDRRRPARKASCTDIYTEMTYFPL